MGKYLRPVYGPEIPAPLNLPDICVLGRMKNLHVRAWVKFRPSVNSLSITPLFILFIYLFIIKFLQEKDRNIELKRVQPQLINDDCIHNRYTYHR